MEKEVFEQYRKAGKILEKVLVYAKSIVKRDALLLEIAEKIEEKIKAFDAFPAFPCNLSINEIAAHYSPFSDDKTIARGLLKLDIGVNYNGYIVDAAISFNLEKGETGKENEKLIKAALHALKKGVAVIKPDVSVSEIGKAIEEEIVKRGFKPIYNLSGHSIERYKLHAGKSIPNYNSKEAVKVSENEVIAIEPFVTFADASGYVIDGKASSIWMQKKEGKPRLYREIFDAIKSFSGLPFSERWLVNFKNYKLALNYFKQQGLLHNFAELVEKTKARVSQAETTIIVKEKPFMLVDVFEIFEK